MHASCEAGNGLAIVSTATNTEVGTVPLPGSATALALDGGTGDIWAAGPFSNQVYVVSDATNSVVAKGPTGGAPFEGIAVDNRTGEVYVTDWKSANVTVFASNATPIASITLPSPTSPRFPPPSPLSWVVLITAVAGGVALVSTVWIRVRRPPPAENATVSGP